MPKRWRRMVRSFVKSATEGVSLEKPKAPTVNGRLLRVNHTSRSPAVEGRREWFRMRQAASHASGLG